MFKFIIWRTQQTARLGPCHALFDIQEPTLRQLRPAALVTRIDDGMEHRIVVKVGVVVLLPDVAMIVVRDARAFHLAGGRKQRECHHSAAAKEDVLAVET